MPPPSPAALRIAAWLGTWSRPSDRPGQVALAIAVALFFMALLPRARRLLLSLVDLSSVADLTRRRPFLIVASFAAAFLSLGYIAFYLRGGPRGPDASIYWLEGRALSHGAFAWTIPEPTASFRARGLLSHVPDRLSGIFPPGYPLLLAMGFLVGAPMLVGPLLAAALVVATWLLAHEVLADAEVNGSPLVVPYRGGGLLPQNGERAEAIARLAGALSILSAALRYHTADALPYGAAAVAVAVSLACALRACRTDQARHFAAAGLGVGFLVASTPASALAIGAVVAGIATRSSRWTRALVWSSVAALPGVLLLLAANHAATGHPLVSPAADHGAGDGTGSTGAALMLPVLRCAGRHLLDVANVEPLTLLALVPLVGRTRRRAALLAGLVVVGQILVQAFRGTDSAQVGDGAGHLICIVPVEHVLMAIGIGRLFRRAFAPAAVATLALSLGGFAVHASHVHEALAASNLGRPSFEPDVPREANVTHGLLFFGDDTGYELACDPGVTASHGIQAVRMRGDDHDRLLYDSLGHPAVHQYVAVGASASVAVWTPLNAGSDTWRFEAESDWPPFAQAGGWAEAVATVAPCASGGRVLRLTPSRRGGQASMAIELPVPRGPDRPEKRVWMVAPRVLQGGGGGSGVVALVSEPGQRPIAEWSWSDSGPLRTCVDLPARPIELGGDRTRAWLVVSATAGPVEYDRTTLSHL